MVTGKRATLLAAGASVIAIGSAMPAYAQNYGGTRDYHVSQNVNSLLTIDLLHLIEGGDVDVSPLDTSANAYVVDGIYGTDTQVGSGADFGAIIQYARALEPVDGDATISIVNDGVALVYATASAFGTADTDVTARAEIVNGVDQYAEAPDDVTINLTNTGTLIVDALAVVDAGGSATTASAYAAVGNGIEQSGSGTHEVLTLTNSGSILVEATASVDSATTGS